MSDEWTIKDEEYESHEAYEAYVKEAEAYFDALDYAYDSNRDLRELDPVILPKAYKLPKPSWIERVLRKLR